MYTMVDLFRESNSSQACIDGKWVPARPIPGPLLWRLHDAWKVLKGEADAFTWPRGQ